jgi:hypothetical protein
MSYKNNELREIPFPEKEKTTKSRGVNLAKWQLLQFELLILNL